MAEFKQLRDVSNTFEEQIRKVSAELFSAKIGETFEDGIAKKMQDLTFFTSKLRLLKAKPIASSPEATHQPHSVNATKEYGELVMWKVLEQAIVKSLTQMHSVKALITAPDRDLDPELVERKEKIIQSLKEYRHHETQLRHLHSVEQEKEEELAAVRQQWDEELTRLRDLQEEAAQFEECDVSGPLYKKLRTMVDKLELMRWLVCRLVTSRGSHDWLAAPSRTARALTLARTHNTVQMFVDGS
ncbi:unnamed protein product [Arctia plantaginis]|uniref:Uncharacterized protein n=1 Tax=Arctia plantaginis TaxID=874455 RepID=A0A8S1AM87_ARCPL|nr:unnamed protein product [Arctia plantaginis]